MLFLLTSCAVTPPEIPTATQQSTPLPTQTQTPVAIPTIKSTSTPKPISTSTQILPSPTITSNPCNPLEWDVPWILLDDDVYFSFGPSSNEIDERLFPIYPQWQDFRQIVTTSEWTTGDVFVQASFGGPEYGVNPAVLLVTVGMELDWQVPPDGDLYSIAVSATKELEDFAVEYYTEDDVKEAYPQIGNQATYAIYKFFGENLDLVETWCKTYQALFKDDYPLKP